MCGSMAKGRTAFAVGTLFIVITEAITVFVGMAAIAFYFGLDPIQLGVINRPVKGSIESGLSEKDLSSVESCP